MGSRGGIQKIAQGSGAAQRAAIEHGSEGFATAPAHLTSSAPSVVATPLCRRTTRFLETTRPYGDRAPSLQHG